MSAEVPKSEAPVLPTSSDDAALQKEFEYCEQKIDEALKDPYVKWVMDAMAKKGCPVDRSYFKCVSCKTGNKIGGGFEVFNPTGKPEDVKSHVNLILSLGDLQLTFFIFRLCFVLMQDDSSQLTTEMQLIMS
jgi:hypothetical protein